jgi:hypothetical protein
MPKKYTNHRSVNLTPELIERLEQMASEHDIAISQIVRVALFEYFSTTGQDPYYPRTITQWESARRPPIQSNDEEDEELKLPWE